MCPRDLINLKKRSKHNVWTALCWNSLKKELLKNLNKLKYLAHQ